MQMIILPGMDVAENMAILMDAKELATKAIFFTVAKHRLLRNNTMLATIKN